MNTTNQIESSVTKKSKILNDKGCEECSFTGSIFNIVRMPPDETSEIPYDKTTLAHCPCRKEWQYMNFNPTADFGEKQLGRTFTNAILDDYNRKQFTMATEFVRKIDRDRKCGDWLYIFGDEKMTSKSKPDAYGTGKTFLMDCIANALSKRRIAGVYVTERKLYGDIKNTFGDSKATATVIDKYLEIPVLLIDDLFSEKYSDWSEGLLFSILDERLLHDRITVITTNYDTSRIHEQLPKNGRKIASRIAEKATMIEMTGIDRRSPKNRKGEAV